MKLAAGVAVVWLLLPILGLWLWLAPPWTLIFALAGLFVWQKHWLRRDEP